MADGTYEKDKKAFFYWVFATLGTVAVTGILSIYGELKTMSQGVIRAQDAIEWMQKKNEEQDKRLDKHDELLFIKSTDLKNHVDDKQH